MCQYCEQNEDYEYDRREDPELEESSAYLVDNGAYWTLVSVQDDHVTETSVVFCPWCSRELN